MITSDGLTLVPWRDGRCATWDVIVTNTVAPSYLSMSSTCAASASKRRPNAKKRNISKLHAIIISFPSPLRLSVLLGRCRLHFCTGPSNLYSLTTHERHISFLNAFPLRSRALMPSVSTIRSAILRWKCDVTSRDTPIYSSCFYHS